MGFSIQDYLKKINSKLTAIDIVSVLVTCVVIALFVMVIMRQLSTSSTNVVYTEGKESKGTSLAPGGVSPEDARPFGSRTGMTYTFSWCQGASRTLAKNKIYFANEDDAKSKGRVMSKLCKR